MTRNEILKIIDEEIINKDENTFFEEQKKDDKYVLVRK